MNVLDTAVDRSEVSGNARKVVVTEQFVHPETKWESKQVVGVFVEGWFYFPFDRTFMDQRIPMVLSEADMRAARMLPDGEHVQVMDLLQNQKYDIQREPCGLGCRCDASAEQVYS